MIKDGKENSIKCSGSVNEPKCVFKETDINMGLIACGKKSQPQYGLKMSQDMQVCFKFQTV